MGEAILFGRGIPVLCDPKFENNSWAKIISCCQRGTVPEEWAVGSAKAMTINGTEYIIDIIGKDHDDYADGSGKAPLTFQMHDCYGTTYRMNSTNTNVGGWAGCLMRTTHLPAIFALMPTEVQAAIREVSKQTTEGSGSTTLNTTADKLFLLSENEVFGSKTYAAVQEGSQYAYYAAGKSKVKRVGTSSSKWWERSPYRNMSTGFCWVNTSAGADGGIDGDYGVSFAFCF